MLTWWREEEKPWIPLYAAIHPTRATMEFSVPCAAEMACRLRILECGGTCTWYNQAVAMRKRSPGFWDPLDLPAGFMLPAEGLPSKHTMALAAHWVERFQQGPVWISGTYREVLAVQIVRLVMLAGQFGTPSPGLPTPWYASLQTNFVPNDGGLLLEVRQGDHARRLRMRRRDPLRWTLWVQRQDPTSEGGVRTWVQAEEIVQIQSRSLTGWNAEETWQWNPHPWPVVLWTETMQTFPFYRPDPDGPQGETALAWAQRTHFPNLPTPPRLKAANPIDQ